MLFHHTSTISNTLNSTHFFIALKSKCSEVNKERSGQRFYLDKSNKLRNTPFRGVWIVASFYFENGAVRVEYALSRLIRTLIGLTVFVAFIFITLLMIRYTQNSFSFDSLIGKFMVGYPIATILMLVMLQFDFYDKQSEMERIINWALI